MSSLVVLAALAVATGMWAFMFLPDRRGIWTRTWIAAGVLSATAVAGLLAVGRLGEIAGPIDATELAIGLAAGAAWLVATHVGYRIIAWLFPSFGAQVRDLYRRLDEEEMWSRYVAELREKYRSLRALQEELTKAKL